jgi:hypothetical protein
MSQSKYKNMTTEQIIADLDAVNMVVDYHYEIENEALKTDDLYNGVMLEYIADTMAEKDNDVMEYEQYKKIAKNIMDKIVDDADNEICERDRDAMGGDY